MRVLHRVHGTTTNLWPAVTLDTVLVVGTASLHDWLVETTTACDDADGGTASVLHPLLGARWETNLGAFLVDILSDDGAVITRAARDHTTVTSTHLNIGDDGTLRHRLHRECVSNNQLCVLAAVHELTSVCSLDCWHQLLVDLVRTSIVESDLGKRCSTTRVMEDVLHDTLEEASTLSEIKHAKLCSSNAVFVVRTEN